MSAPPTTVVFNVGGKKYEVSRSLLDEHPDTMLARMVSEMWLPEADRDKELFVERDSERFLFVLDFMRDNAVTVPFLSNTNNNITKQSILKELTYFGFQNVDENAISVEFNPFDAPRCLAAITKDHEEEFDTMKKERDDLNYRLLGSSLAHACCVRYLTNGNLNVQLICDVDKSHESYEPVADDADHKLDIDVCKMMNEHKHRYDKNYSRLLPFMNKFLLKYGLRGDNISVDHHTWRRRYEDEEESVVMVSVKLTTV
jgi:hypothetical protein